MKWLGMKRTDAEVDTEVDDKDKALVVVYNGLTSGQAANMQSDAIKSKYRNAPDARASVVVGHQKDVGKMLSDGHKQTGLQETKEVKAIEPKKKR